MTGAVEGESGRRRSILYLQSNSEIGGSDVALLRIIGKLNKSRFHPYVMLPADGPLVSSFKKSGCEVVIVKKMLKLTTRRGAAYFLRYLINYPIAVWRILRFIRKERVDIVHTNTIHNLYGFLAARLAKKPHVWHVREIILQSKIVRRLELFLARHFADRIVAVSAAVTDMFVDSEGKIPRNLRIMRDGIDLDRYHPANDGSRIFNDLKISSTTRLVGLVGRLDHWKGVDVFLNAVARCTDRFPDARFLVIGGAVEGREDFAEALIAQAEKLGIQDKVYFTGWRYGPELMPAAHAALTVLVLASTWPEPFGLVLLEAMASGKPVIATNHGGPTEICVEGETALLVPPRDVGKLAEAIGKLLGDSRMARGMGEAGRRRVEQYFDENNYIEELEMLYDELTLHAA